VKENGQFTYFFSDMLYHSEKLSRSDSLIVIMGADHHGYISRLKSFCELLENKGDKISLVIVQTLSLLTSDGDKRKFSKRLGNSITLDDILQVSEVDQLKFLLLEKESNQPISLNIELLEKNQEKTRLYYIQYAYARSFQIIKKAHEKNFLVTKNKTDLLRDNKEKKIKNLIARFRFVLDNCSEERKHHYLLHYLFELSSA
jgi:arginyl-tRNA synthetase